MIKEKKNKYKLREINLPAKATKDGVENTSTSPLFKDEAKWALVTSSSYFPIKPTSILLL